MPVRFRRTFKILPGVKVNMSKGGISFTVGTKGYHLNFSKRGVRQTVGLPGSGLSQTSYIIKNDPEPETRKSTESKREKEKKDTDKDTDTDNDVAEERVAEEKVVEQPVAPRRRSPTWVLLLGLVVIYLGAVLLGLIPTNFLSQFLRTITDFTRGMGL